MQKVRQKD